MSLYGSARDNSNKRLKRITVALSLNDMELIEEIADAKGLSNSEVINLLIRPTIQTVREQEDLIKQSPLTVAFDLVTKG